MSPESLTYNDPTLRCDCYVIVPRNGKPQVLMVNDQNGWTLPHFECEEHHPGVVGHIVHSVRDKFDLSVTVLRNVHQKYDRESHYASAVYSLENKTGDWTRLLVQPG